VCQQAARCRPLQPGGQLPLEYAAHHGRVNLTKLLIQARNLAKWDDAHVCSLVYHYIFFHYPTVNLPQANSIAPWYFAVKPQWLHGSSSKNWSIWLSWLLWFHVVLWGRFVTDFRQELIQILVVRQEGCGLLRRDVAIVSRKHCEIIRLWIVCMWLCKLQNIGQLFDGLLDCLKHHYKIL